MNILFLFKLPINTEIFPKQTQLGVGSDQKPINGNFINLPYYNRNERVCVNLDGTEFSFEQFIKVVEANTKTKEELEEFARIEGIELDRRRSLKNMAKDYWSAKE
mgnify:CR=1 FL=1